MNSRLFDNPLLFFKSIFVGTIDLIYRASKDLFGTLSRFNTLIFDEPIAVIITEHRKVARVLNHPSIRPFIKRYPSVVTKYFGNYLAKRFSTNKNSRRVILKFHYQHLIKHVTDDFFVKMLEHEIVLWDEEIDGNNYTISLSPNVKVPKEGDLRLALYQNRTLIYALSFTVVPGRLINSAADQVLLVANLQGARGELERIRVATKACDGVMPPYLLMTAAGSIASALATNIIAGVSNKEHVLPLEIRPPEFSFDYDVFWETFTFQRGPVGIYEISVPFTERHLGQISHDRRHRAKRKRQFKQRVAVRVSATFSKSFQKH
jgi:uncharacterized protein VirK/YbjX